MRLSHMQPVQRRGAALRRMPASAPAVAAALATVLLTLLPSGAPAHDGHAALAGRVLSVTAAEGGARLAIELWNGGGRPVVLRGIETAAGPATLRRRRGLLGLSILQPVRFVRIGPGELLILAPPDWQATVDATPAEVWRAPPVADFGPAGRLTLEGAPPVDPGADPLAPPPMPEVFAPRAGPPAGEFGRPQTTP